ncbi:MAG: hypothetical protein JWM86_1233 [Thermoleophilia bacterium]|nr:hypothetical protein [Thermoleophilia bacterium]
MKLSSGIGRSTAGKVLLSAALLGTAASIAGLGTFATFTGSTSASHAISAGTVTASLGAAGGTDNRLTVGASGIAAGDTVQRVVKLTNSGSLAWASAALTTSASTSSLLDTDATDGLQLKVDRCDVAWTETGTAPAYSYTCSGTQSAVVASRPVIGSAIALGSLDSLSVGGSDYLRVTLALPSSADNSFQGEASTLDFDFIGTQRAASSH